MEEKAWSTFHRLQACIPLLLDFAKGPGPCCSQHMAEGMATEGLEYGWLSPVEPEMRHTQVWLSQVTSRSCFVPWSHQISSSLSLEELEEKMFASQCNCTLSQLSKGSVLCRPYSGIQAEAGFTPLPQNIQVIPAGRRALESLSWLIKYFHSEATVPLCSFAGQSKSCSHALTSTR